MTSALVMCGGQGTRVKGDTEKPLLRVAGTPIVARVLDALQKSRKFDRIVAAVTPKTPKTRSYLNARHIEVIETPGNGYSSDLSLALKPLKPAKVFVISADMPLITSRTVQDILSAPRRKPLLSVVLESEFVRAKGFTPSITFRENGIEYCYAGISVFDTSRLSADGLAEEFLVMKNEEVAANINTKRELQLAEKLLIQRS